MATTVFLHYEESEPFHTMKLALDGSRAVTVADAISWFVDGYTGAHGGANSMADRAVSVRTHAGQSLGPAAIMPCGLPAGTDLFVVTDSAGQRAGDAAASTAAAAAEASAVRASQAKLGENSYYYSVNKNLGNTITEPEPLVPKAKRVVSAVLRQTTISNYAMIDGEGKVKVNIPLAGAQALAANAIVLSVFDRAFKLRIRTDASSELTLNIPILLEEIMQHECAVKVLNGRVVIHLPKRDADRPWYELRKTKGVGDTEYDKLVPYAGEEVTVIAGGRGDVLPEITPEVVMLT